jgi:heptosyltransferase-3
MFRMRHAGQHYKAYCSSESTGKRIFIHHGGALGDLLLSLHAIGALRSSGDMIHLAGRPDIVGFLMKTGYINEMSDSGSPLFLPLFTGVDDGILRRFLGGFDKVCVFTVNAGSEFMERMRSMVTDMEVIQTIPPEGSRAHVSDYRLQQLFQRHDLARSESHPLPALTIPPVCMEKARETLQEAGYDFKRPLTAIHPGSGGRRKRWPLDHFRGLATMLRESQDHFLLLFSGPSEKGEVQRGIVCVASDLGRGCLHVSDPELVFAASLLGLCDFYVGNDAGITHLASFFTKRVIAIFGPTDPAMWRPVFSGCVVISADRECAPCENEATRHPRGESPTGCQGQCLTDIPVQAIYNAIVEPL